MSVSDGDLVIIGRLGRTHGIAGELRARATGPTLATIAVGSEVIVDVASTRRSLRLSSLRDSGGDFLLCFHGITSKEAAAELVNATLAVAPDSLRALDADDEFYVRDLIGCRVWVGAHELGEVTDVSEGTANDALVVTTADDEARLVPFTHDAVEVLDVPGRRIVIRADLFGGDDA